MPRGAGKGDGVGVRKTRSRARATDGPGVLVRRLLRSSPDPLAHLARTARAAATAIEYRERLFGDDYKTRWHYGSMKLGDLATLTSNPAAMAEHRWRTTRREYLAACEYALLRGVTFATPADVIDAQVFEES